MRLIYIIAAALGLLLMVGTAHLSTPARLAIPLVEFGLTLAGLIGLSVFILGAVAASIRTEDFDS